MKITLHPSDGDPREPFDVMVLRVPCMYEHIRLADNYEVRVVRVTHLPDGTAEGNGEFASTVVYVERIERENK
jgi:hypothetical protein